MGFLYKLREWVGTVTGKGVRWGRDSLGRSEPAFLRASTTVLPPFTCTARGQPTSSAAVVLAARPANCGPFGCFEACAGRRIRWLCLPAVLVLRAVCACLSLPAMPTALNSSCPRSILLAPVHFAPLCFAPVHCHVRQDRRLGPAVC